MRYAVRNIGRLKARSLLTLAMAFVLFFLSMFGILTGKLCRDSRARFYGPLDGSVYVTDDTLTPFLSYRAALTLAENSGVISSVSAIKEYTAFLIDIEYVGKGMFKRTRYPGEAISPTLQVDYIEGLRLCGVTSMEILEEVYGGTLTMTEGTMITERNNERHDNKIVISDTLAEKNGLSVGDVVSLAMLSLFHEEQMLGTEDNRYFYDYIVGGIYHNAENNLGSVSKPWLVNDNRIYVPISTVEDITENERVRFCYETPELMPGLALSSAIDNPLLIPDSLYFHLSDMETAEALEAEIGKIGFIKEVKLTKYMSDAATSPSARLSQMISILLIGIVAIGFVILLLVIFFNMNARHRELAVLSALGKRRSAVSASFFLEVLLLFLAGFLLAAVIFAGAVSLCAAPITAYLNAAEISAQISNETADFVLLGDPGSDHILEKMADFSYLAGEYILPAMLVTAALAGVILLGVYLFVRLYVSRINALSAVGGKE